MTMAERSEKIVEVLLPYDQNVTPYGRRTHLVETLWKKHAIEVRNFTASEAPIAYRILPVGQRGSGEPYSIRFHDGRFWWPIGDVSASIGADRFRAEAAVGSRWIQDVLGVSSMPPFQAQLRDEKWLDKLYPACRLLSNTFDAQTNRANHGAEKIAFCGGQLLFDAGPPLYYAIERTDREEFEIDASCYPTSDDTLVLLDSGLPGPGRGLRRRAAADCLAFGPSELEELIRRLADRGTPVRHAAEIESVMTFPDTAAEGCAYSLVEEIWNGRASKSSWDWPWLHRNVPSLVEFGYHSDSADTSLHRRILGEFVALDFGSFGDKGLTEKSLVALEILTRLGPDEPLSQADEEALSLFEMST